jgi:hypothetical protein
MRSALPTWKPPISKVHLVAQSFENGKAVMALAAASRAVPTTNHHVGEKQKREDEDNEVINRRIISNTPKVSPYVSELEPIVAIGFGGCYWCLWHQA